MWYVRESEVEGEHAPVPNSRTLKNLVAPWTVGSVPLWVGMSEIDSGSSSKRHSHPNEEGFFAVSGTGRIEVGEEQEHVDVGTPILIPADAAHRLVNEGDEVLKVLSCAASAFSWEDFRRRHLLDRKPEAVLGDGEVA